MKTESYTEYICLSLMLNSSILVLLKYAKFI